MIETKLEQITPAIAERYLAKNFKGNRPLRPSSVRDYANKMLAGEWVATHQGIAFDQNGFLIDGQNRLSAVIMSGVTITTMVTYGLPADSFKAFDIGAKRKMSDILRVPKPHAEIATFLAKLVCGNKPTVTQVELMYGKIQESIAVLLEECASTRKNYSAAPVKSAAVFSMVMRPRSIDYVKKTYRGLVLFDICDTAFPLVGKAFIRQCETTNKAGSMDPRDLFTRGMILFDPSKANISKIQISEGTVDMTINLLRDHFSSLYIVDLVHLEEPWRKREHPGEAGFGWRGQSS